MADQLVTIKLCNGRAFEVGPVLVFNGERCPVVGTHYDGETGTMHVTFRAPEGALPGRRPADVSLYAVVKGKELVREEPCRSRTRLITIRK